MPLWAMLGQFEPADIKVWAGVLGQDLLWMYVMVSNVLLVNLLIAMMGDTCARPHVPPPLISDSLEARGRTGHSAPRGAAQVCAHQGEFRHGVEVRAARLGHRVRC